MELSLLFSVLIAVALFLFLILKLRIQAFLALLIASMAIGLMAGMPYAEILNTIQSGMAGTLGATVVGLGALLGAILEISGGAQAVADGLIKLFGEKKANTAMVLTGFIIAIPVFFDVAFIILIPMLYSLQKRTGKSLLYFGIPLLAGLATTHAFIPPTPGPVAVADILHAELGWVMLFGILVGLPTAYIAGPVFGNYISKKINVAAPDYFETDGKSSETQSVSLGLIVSIVAVPIVLIIGANLVTSGIIPGNFLGEKGTEFVKFIGHPFTSLILVNILAWYVLGIRRGHTKEELLKVSTKSLGPAGMIILLTGAGGVFKQMLVNTKAGEMIANGLVDLGFPTLIFAFITAVIVRVLQGSATVAMITAAGLVSPLVTSLDAPNKALLVIVIAAGASILSHVNDSGFWLVNRYFGISEKDTLRSWTVCTTLIAICGLFFSGLISFFI